MSARCCTLINVKKLLDLRHDACIPPHTQIYFSSQVRNKHSTAQHDGKRNICFLIRRGCYCCWCWCSFVIRSLFFYYIFYVWRMNLMKTIESPIRWTIEKHHYLHFFRVSFLGLKTFHQMPFFFYIYLQVEQTNKKLYKKKRNHLRKSIIYLFLFCATFFCRKKPVLLFPLEHSLFSCWLVHFF